MADAESLSKAQSDTAASWDKVYDVIDGNRFPHEFLVKFIFFSEQWRHFDRLRALDIGFGSFANLNMCHELGYEIFGIEVSQRALTKTSAQFAERDVPFSGQMFQSPTIPHDAESFELIFSSQAIYYNLELEAMIGEIHRCLVPGGTFYLTFFASDHWYFEHSEPVAEGLVRWSETHPTSHLRGMTLRYFETKDDLAPLFEGFANVRLDDLRSNILGIDFHLWVVTAQKPKDELVSFDMQDHYGNIERIKEAPGSTQEASNRSTNRVKQ
jgi:SAM-dependent methyltransferase